MSVVDAAALTVVEAVDALARGRVSAVELTEACLARIDADGPPTFDGAPDAVNAWVRVYAEDAREQAAAADARRAREGTRAPWLCGVPIGLKDLYAVAGKPLTASSRAVDEHPQSDSRVWERLRGAGMVLLGHLHTHECAAGGSTDQVGNPWALDRVAGGSSGGSAAALAAHMVPAATGSDTAGSLRIPSALCGTSTIKPTLGSVSLEGVIPLSRSLDHAGPMARTLADCRLLLEAMVDAPLPRAAPHLLAGARVAVSPRIAAAAPDADVAAGFDVVLELLRALGAELVEPAPPETDLDVGADFFDLLGTEMLDHHRRYADRRDRYRPSSRELLEHAERHGLDDEQRAAAHVRRGRARDAWTTWFAEHRLDALVEPTVPFVAPPRGHGYDHFVIPDPYTALTHLWNWTGFPVVAMPAGLGARSDLPVSVSLVAPAGHDGPLLDMGVALQAELGVPAFR
jgi:aspartyl-tRNA(Asn)/glutamyl-tRNA(Gln) amidotransferase subunit A